MTSLKTREPASGQAEMTPRPSRLFPPKPEKPKFRSPVLRFSPTAWAKLLYFRDRQETEVGGFAVTSPKDLLKVEDFLTVRQEVSCVSVCFDDAAVADYFDAQADAGRRPEQFARIWLHTHPGNSAEPSATDEQTFSRVFGGCQWAVMFILARGGQATARLRFNVGPGGQVIIPVEVDYASAFPASDLPVWEQEYQANIRGASFLHSDREHGLVDWPGDLLNQDWLEGLEDMTPAERRQVLEDLQGELGAYELQEVAYGR